MIKMLAGKLGKINISNRPMQDVNHEKGSQGFDQWHKLLRKREWT